MDRHQGSIWALTGVRYELVFKARSQRQLASLPKYARRAVAKKLDALAKSAVPAGDLAPRARTLRGRR